MNSNFDILQIYIYLLTLGVKNYFCSSFDKNERKPLLKQQIKNSN